MQGEDKEECAGPESSSWQTSASPPAPRYLPTGGRSRKSWPAWGLPATSENAELCRSFYHPRNRAGEAGTTAGVGLTPGSGRTMPEAEAVARAGDTPGGAGSSESQRVPPARSANQYSGCSSDPAEPTESHSRC